MRTYIILFLSLAVWSCTKDTSVIISDDVLSEEPIYPIDIKPGIEQGVLIFPNNQEFFHAMSFLDTVTLESRIAWEEALGFRSLRSIYEELVIKHMNNEPIDKEKYIGIIDFEREIPRLLHHSKHAASVMNEKGYVYVGNEIGSIRREGCYWSSDRNKESLDYLILSQKTNEEKGLFFFENRISEFETVQFRECADPDGNGGPFSISDFAQDGSGNGSSRIASDLEYEYTVGTKTPPGTRYLKVFFKLSGTAYRRTSNKWRGNRTDHLFSWNFTVDHIFNGDLLQTYHETGTETHYNNITAAKEIILDEGLRSTTELAQTRYPLIEVVPEDPNQILIVGTKHSTSALTPIGVIYGCN